MARMTENISGTDTPAATTPTVPEKPALEGLEEKLSAQWADEQIYHFAEGTPRESVYSIDTPPPTASGSLHVGHMFSYTHTDVVARYKRMQGYQVFYPLGWDDNGLPTERRVQNYYGVRCDPAQPYVADYTPPEKPAKNQRDWDAISRKNSLSCAKSSLSKTRRFSKTSSRSWGSRWTGARPIAPSTTTPGRPLNGRSCVMCVTETPTPQRHRPCGT